MYTAISKPKFSIALHYCISHMTRTLKIYYIDLNYNIIIIELAFLEAFLEACVMEPVLWLM